MVTSPSVDVSIPLLGWTHIGGPSIHLLVALGDDDETLLRASDAADNDDLDAVIDVLTEHGPRTAPAFVGVHTGDVTRVVAHGTAWIEVETPEGQRILTPPSARVWLDADLEGQVLVVRLRAGALPPEMAERAGSAVGSSASPTLAPVTTVGAPAPVVSAEKADPAPGPAATAPEPAALAAPLLPPGSGSGGPRGWLSEPEPEPNPPTLPEVAPESIPSPAPRPVQEASAPPPATDTAGAPRVPHPAVAEAASVGSAPSPGAFVDGLPSWNDHRPALAGASAATPPAPNAPPASAAAASAGPVAPQPDAVLPEPPAAPAAPEVTTAESAGQIPVVPAPEPTPAAAPASPMDAPGRDTGPDSERATPVPAASDVVEHTLTALPLPDAPPSARTPVSDSSADPTSGPPAPEAEPAPGPASNPSPPMSSEPVNLPVESVDEVPVALDPGYDHLFGRTADRDAYLAKLVALGAHGDEFADDDDPGPRHRTGPDAPSAEGGPAAGGGPSRSTGEPAATGPTALPSTLHEASAEPGSPVPGTGTLISSVPWAAPSTPSGGSAPSGTGRPTDPEPVASASPEAPQTAEVPLSTPPAGAPHAAGGWSAPAAPGAPMRQAAGPTGPTGPATGPAIGPATAGGTSSAATSGDASTHASSSMPPSVSRSDHPSVPPHPAAPPHPATPTHLAAASPTATTPPSAVTGRPTAGGAAVNDAPVVSSATTESARAPGAPEREASDPSSHAAPAEPVGPGAPGEPAGPEGVGDPVRLGKPVDPAAPVVAAGPRATVDPPVPPVVPVATSRPFSVSIGEPEFYSGPSPSPSALPRPVPDRRESEPAGQESTQAPPGDEDLGAAVLGAAEPAPDTAVAELPAPEPTGAPAFEPAPEPAIDPASEPDDRTVDRSALLAREQANGLTGPSVMGVRCASGHPNPPHSSRCRECSRPIPEQQPVAMMRPPLGFLRLASGDLVTLDRGVVLGRAPKPALDDVPVASRPHVVRVASPDKDVSRTHLEVVLDGWHVLVRDLFATNGTVVTLPGRPPVRLRPDEPQLIEPGTRICLADEVELTFEVER